MTDGFTSPNRGGFNAAPSNDPFAALTGMAFGGASQAGAFGSNNAKPQAAAPTAAPFSDNG